MTQAPPITTLTCGSTTVMLTDIEVSDKQSRRERERQVVERLVKASFGPDARLGHYPSGAPYIIGDATHISISHGAGIAALAYDATRPVGIDVEAGREQLQRVRSRFVRPDEEAIFGESIRGLLLGWCIKEAVYKAAGQQGLSLTDIRTHADADGTLSATVGASRFSIIPLRTGEVSIVLAVRESE